MRADRYDFLKRDNMEKKSFMRTVDVLLWLMGLIVAAGYYFQHRGTPQAYWGFFGLTAMFIVSFVFQVIKFFVRISIFLFLLTALYFLFIRH